MHTICVQECMQLICSVDSWDFNRSLTCSQSKKYFYLLKNRRQGKMTCSKSKIICTKIWNIQAILCFACNHLPLFSHNILRKNVPCLHLFCNLVCKQVSNPDSTYEILTRRMHRALCCHTFRIPITQALLRQLWRDKIKEFEDISAAYFADFKQKGHRPLIQLEKSPPLEFL